jgi:hypothetical protein
MISGGKIKEKEFKNKAKPETNVTITENNRSKKGKRNIFCTLRNKFCID